MAESLLDSILARLASKQHGDAASSGAIAELPYGATDDSTAAEYASGEGDGSANANEDEQASNDENSLDAPIESILPEPLPPIRSKDDLIRSAPLPEDAFIPVEPKSFHQAKLTESEVEALILKFLLSKGNASGREMSDQLKLPFILLEE